MDSLTTPSFLINLIVSDSPSQSIVCELMLDQKWFVTNQQKGKNREEAFDNGLK